MTNQNYTLHLLFKFIAMEQPLSSELKDFIATHLSDNTDQLILQAHRYPGIDVPLAADQILARRHIKDKLPLWYANPDLLFPSRLSAEQCSSATTAAYKQSLLRGPRVCDLTGGLGVDSWYFSQTVPEVTYVERNADYCRIAKANFKTLGATNISVLHTDASLAAADLSADTFYADPARRSGTNKRLFALTDCEPDMLQLIPVLLPKAQRVILKISPMADLSETLRLLPLTTELHILAVRNECKEILLVIDQAPTTEPLIIASNFEKEKGWQSFTFTLQEERQTTISLATKIQDYLYEPHAALLKSGAFKTIASRYRVEKLHQHSHLYTSSVLNETFPGRKFQVEEIYPFSGKNLKQLRKYFPKANITVRNFPVTVEDLRKKSGITEGGDTYILATTLHNAQRVLIRCRKI